MTTEIDLKAPVDGSVPTSDLVTRLSTQLTTLIRDEMALARVELQTKAKRAGTAGGMFGTAGMLALYGVGLLLALGVVLLDIAWPLWLAVLVVLAVVFVTAGILALAGRSRLRSAMPLAPTETVERIRGDVDMVKSALKDRNHR